jgi:hypothetical protein
MKTIDKIIGQLRTARGVVELLTKIAETETRLSCILSNEHRDRIMEMVRKVAAKKAPHTIYSYSEIMEQELYKIRNEILQVTDIKEYYKTKILEYEKLLKYGEGE